MDKWFYSVEMEGDRKVIHVFGNVYLDDTDETETCYRIMELTGLYMTIDEWQELGASDESWSYFYEHFDYCGDLTKQQAEDICKSFFDGDSGIELDISLVNENTPCGDYWC